MKTVKKSIILGCLTMVLAGTSLNTYAWKLFGKETECTNTIVPADDGCIAYSGVEKTYFMGIVVNTQDVLCDIECSLHDE